MASASTNRSDLLAKNLPRLLDRIVLKKVYVAGSQFPPPASAYLVNFPRVSIPIKGTDVMEMEIDGKVETISVRPGSAVFIPPNCWNKPTWAFPVQVCSILFGKKQIGLSLVEHRKKEDAPQKAVKSHLPNIASSPLVDIVHAMLALGNQSSALLPLTQALVACCLELIQQPSQVRQRKALGTYENICLHVQEKFSSSITRESVAKTFSITPNHVSRLFKHEGYLRFNDYLSRVRVDRAKFLLKNHRQTIQDVASSCGYSDSTYFCRVFKKYTRETPTEYRCRLA